MHTSLLPNPLTPAARLTLILIYYSSVLLKDPRVPLIPLCTFGNPKPSLCTFRTRSPTSQLISDAFPTIAPLEPLTLTRVYLWTRYPTSRLFADAFPTIVSLLKRTISLTAIRNTFVFMHVVSYLPNSFWDKQARAAHGSWILYGKNLK